MPVTPTSSSAQSAAASVPANPKGDMSSQDTFMKLLVAELKHQDPMDPMQARDMVGQLAQLTSVQKLSTIDEKLEALQRGSVDEASMQSTSLIGKTVTARTNRLTVDSFGASQGAYNLDIAADNVSVKITDGAGQTVRSIDLGAQRGGPQSFQWDGRDGEGRRVPNGGYAFDISASDAQGNPVATTMQVSGVVSEITYTNGAPELVVGDARVGLPDVTSVGQ